MHDTTARAIDHSTHGWGTAVHLGRLAEGTLPDSAGVSERVTTAIPLDHLPSVSVQLLGGVSGARGGKVNHDDDDAFAEALLASQTPDDIVEGILGFLP